MASILQEAQEIIYGDREQTYGHPAKNLNTIAQYWSEHIEKEITANDVCIMMCLLKLARLKNQPTHRDSITDTAGYAALMERVQE